MSNSIDHLDFYPEDPETISAMLHMAEMDGAQSEAQLQQKRKRRVRIAMASIATSMALGGSGLGYIANNDSQKQYGSTISQIPETACMTLVGIVGGALVAGGALELYGRKHPIRQNY